MTNIYAPNNKAWKKKYMEQKLPKMKDVTAQKLQLETSISHSQWLKKVGKRSGRIQKTAVSMKLYVGNTPFNKKRIQTFQQHTGEHMLPIKTVLMISEDILGLIPTQEN